MKRIPREWTSYEYYDPKVVLPRLHQIRIAVSASQTPEEIKNLRTNTLKPEKESWHAAIFCYLLSRMQNTDIYFSRVESSDYDSIFTWNYEGTQCYAPIQLKELVPKYKNPDATLESLIEDLKKYANSSNLIVGIKLTRETTIDFSKIHANSIRVAQIWCFGAICPDEKKWGLFGDLRKEFGFYEYELPRN